MGMKQEELLCLTSPVSIAGQKNERLKTVTNVKEKLECREKKHRGKKG